MDIQNVKIQLAMQNVVANYNGKIWVFLNEDIEGVIRDEDEQQKTCDFKIN